MIHSKDINSFNRLLRLSKNKSLNDYKSHSYFFSAMLINKNQFVIGFNDYKKTHPNGEFPRTKHAEIDVLSKWNSNWDINNSTIYVCGIIINSGNFCKSSKPCNNCFNEIKKFNIPRIIYSSYNNNTFILNEIVI